MAALIKAIKKNKPVSLLLSLTLTQICLSQQAHKTSEWPQYRQRTAPVPFSHPFAKRIFVGKSYTWKKNVSASKHFWTGNERYHGQELSTLLSVKFGTLENGIFPALENRSVTNHSLGAYVSICAQERALIVCKDIWTTEFCYLSLGRLLLAQFLHG